MSYFVNNLLYDPCIHAEQPAYMMAANAGVIKAIVSFYGVDSDTAFERHRSRIPTNDLNTVHALKMHLTQFLGLKELTINTALEISI